MLELEWTEVRSSISVSFRCFTYIKITIVDDDRVRQPPIRESGLGSDAGHLVS